MKEKDSCDWEKANERRKLGNETIIEKKTKKNKEIRNDCEAEDGEKNKKGKRYSDEIGWSKSSKVVTLRKTGKRKQDDIDFGACEETDNFNKEMKKKSKKKKQSEDSKAEEGNKDFVKDTKKEFKKKKEKQSKDSEVEEGNKDSTKDATKKREKKQSRDLESEQKKMNFRKDGKKKGKKQKYSKNDENMTTPSSKSVKRVDFSDQVEVFASEDEEIEDEEMGEEEEEEEEEAGGGKLVRGKRFTKEEDELIKKTVFEYIDNNNLGDKGINMVLKSRSHPEVKDCWQYIASALPWRPQLSVYSRGHMLFERRKGKLTGKELEEVKQFVEKHGPKWVTLAESLGKHKWRVRDAWRKIKFPKKGKWSREEYQTLFDLVNNDLRLKAFQEKKSKHGMLRDNIHWTAISDQLGTRYHSFCCAKWYNQLSSPMVAKGIWASVDDYRLLDELVRLDATCIDDVDWDNLVEHRDGEICRKRWNQMVLHIGVPGSKTFTEQVEILSNRYCPDLAKEREDFDNRPFDDSEAPPRK